jgi:predicted lipoprotein with Yx(FWY)xxD motif
VTGKPTVGTGLNASLVATTARSDGEPEVTYNGHPLYLFINDQKAGDTTGQGVNAFGAKWFVLSPAGIEIGGQ